MTYYAVVENGKVGDYTATVFGLPGCTAHGTTREEALTRLREAFTEHLTRVEIVPLEVEEPVKENPWMRYAGIFKDDPMFDEVIEYMAAYRRELDAREDVP